MSENERVAPEQNDAAPANDGSGVHPAGRESLELCDWETNPHSGNERAEVLFDGKECGVMMRTRKQSVVANTIDVMEIDFGHRLSSCTLWTHAMEATVERLEEFLLQDGTLTFSGLRRAIGVDVAASSRRITIAWLNNEGDYAGAVAWLDDSWGGDPCGTCVGCGARSVFRKVAAETWVYFIRAGKDGPIKIGRAANVTDRMRQLQTGCPEPLRLLLKIPGGGAVEAMLHAYLERDSHRGEWFRPSRELLDLIVELGGKVTR